MKAFLGAYHALPRPTLYGHRGCRPAAPENTLAAFRLAHEQGADAVELDVRPLRTGELVVMHDPTLARTANDPRLVAALTLTELASVRVGGTEPVPTLVDAVALCRELGMGLNVELKRDVPSRFRAARTAAETLLRHARGLAVIVSSFDPWMLGTFRWFAREIPTALLVEPDSARRFRTHLLAKYMGVAIHPDRTLATGEAIERWHAQGLKVAVWTVNAPDEITNLCRLGVDGIITDDPGTARHALRAAQGLGSDSASKTF